MTTSQASSSSNSGLNTDMSRHPLGTLERLDDGGVRAPGEGCRLASWQADFMPVWQQLQAKCASLYPDATTGEGARELADRVKRAQSDAADTI